MCQEQPSEESVPQYPTYGPQYAREKIDIWKNTYTLAWLVVSAILILASVIGYGVMYADQITTEHILAGLLIVGVSSMIVFLLYALSFHDFKD